MANPTPRPSSTLSSTLSTILANLSTPENPTFPPAPPPTTTTTPIPRTLISLILRILRFLICVGLSIDPETWNRLRAALNQENENELLADLLELCLLMVMQALLGFLASREFLHTFPFRIQDCLLYGDKKYIYCLVLMW